MYLSFSTNSHQLLTNLVSSVFSPTIPVLNGPRLPLITYIDISVCSLKKGENIAIILSLHKVFFTFLVNVIIK